jgi:hypothetical protein
VSVNVEALTKESLLELPGSIIVTKTREVAFKGKANWKAFTFQVIQGYILLNSG